jgi:hypothetical protein
MLQDDHNGDFISWIVPTLREVCRLTAGLQSVSRFDSVSTCPHRVESVFPSLLALVYENETHDILGSIGLDGGGWWRQVDGIGLLRKFFGVSSRIVPESEASEFRNQICGRIGTDAANAGTPGIL